MEQNWYLDADADGYGNPGTSALSCGQPDDYVSLAGDCDDGLSTINPGQDELCDAVDNDCDGLVDEDDAQDAPTWYPDEDGDGYGDDSLATSACANPGDYLSVGGDCDDARAEVSPSASESCDDIDNDCDGETDEEDAVDATLYYADSDEDGYGATDSTITSCREVTGYTEINGDCDDDTPGVNPDADETCFDRTDNDCDGIVDACEVSLSYLFYGDDADDSWGYSVVWNPDGWFAVSSPGSNQDGSSVGVNVGAVHRLDSVSGKLQHGSGQFGKEPGDQYGSAIAWAGDVDADGQADFLVAASGYQGTDGTAFGGVYYHSGGLGSGYNYDAVIAGGDDGFGKAVSGAGDVDGDSYEEIIIAGALAVYLFEGPISNDMTTDDADTHFEPETSRDEFGKSLANGVDWDGDGLSDQVIGAPEEDTAAFTAGAAYLFLGPLPASLNASDADMTIRGDAASEYLGLGAHFADDLDGDGSPDLVLHGDADAWVFHSNSSGEVSATTADAHLPAVNETSSATSCDTNADGFSDLVVGDDSTGAIFVALGPISGTLPLASANFVLGSGSTTLGLGISVACGDLDDDGLDDVAAGIPGYSSGGWPVGGLYIELGSDLPSP